MVKKAWWKECVVYQIYPRSFKDSNGDGIGDLKGITEKIDYLKDLGVDVIWLCPIYKSPNSDNGYDISDYYDIMDEFGTMQDWEELKDGLHKRQMKLMMDIVLNHTSDEHQWFIESKSSRSNPYRDYYIWRKSRNGKEPNNWRSFFSTSAWEYDQLTDDYYLHLYSKKMPDLNWQNPRMRQEIYAMIRWWLKKGVDGFRFDSINTISKYPDFPDAPVGSIKYVRGREFFTNGPQMHEILHEIYELIKDRDIMTVGECSSADSEEALKMVAEERKELNMIHRFEHDELDWGESGPWEIKKWKLSDLKKIFAEWQDTMHGRGWNSFFWGNHDLPRAVSRFGNDKEYRVPSAKLLATCLLTMEGTPFIYQGDEIGMTNAEFEDINDYRDIDTFNYFREASDGSNPQAEIMERIKYRSRDNARTPMQWNNQFNAGFTGGTPWIKVNPNYTDINVEEERKNSQSILNYYKQMIKIRKENPALIYGKFKTYDLNDEQIYCYTRTLGTEAFLIVMNFSGDSAVYTLPDGISLKEANLVISNYNEHSGRRYDIKREISFKPYESRVYKLL